VALLNPHPPEPDVVFGGKIGVPDPPA
jgi:hypothetical protein